MGVVKGRPNKAHESIAKLIREDPAMKSLAMRCLSRTTSKDDAAYQMFHVLQGKGQLKTPDGARYTVTAIRAALRGFPSEEK